MSSNLIGQVILNRYRVDQFIEAGGMGAVYRIWDLTRNVPLAMKVLHDDFSDDPSVWKMFQREADALRNLTHPNIVPFYGLFRTPDFGFFLEHYIDGPSLKHILRHRKDSFLSIKEVLPILKALCASLGYAHHNGIIHCDIKPGNVILDRGGNIYLTDFGIARHAGSSTTTMAGAGTPAYMAPEQIRAESVTPATDVYALGILLFEILTGQRPFRGNEAETEHLGASTDQRICYAQLNLAPPDPTRLNPAIPPELSRVIAQAMAKDPSGRFQSTPAFFSALCYSTGTNPQTIPDRIEIFIEPGIAYTDHLQSTGPDRVSSTNQPALPLKPQGWIRSNLALLITAGGLLSFAGVAVLAVVVGLLISKNLKAAETPPSQPQAAETAGQQILPTEISSIPTITNQNESIGEEVNPTEARIDETSPVPADPTKTPTTISTLEEYNAPLYTPLPGCASSHIHSNDWVMITFGGGRNAIRSTPDTHPTDNKIGFAEQGELIYVIDGPECNYGWLLWKVKTSSGIEGWTPETDGKRFFLEPFPGWNACPNSPLSLLHKGDAAKVTQYPPVSNRVRSAPGTTAERLGSIEPGESLTILDGPECKDGFVWWYISAEKGLKGWTAEGEQNNYFLIPVPKPH